MLKSLLSRRPQRSKHRSSRAYVLIVSMMLLFCSFLLLLSLTIWSQRASIMASSSRVDLLRQRLAQGLRVELEAELARTPDAVPTLTNYSPPGAVVGATLDWGNSTSSYVPFDPSSISALFGNWQKTPPALGYADLPAAGQAAPVPPWHSLALSTLPGNSTYQTVVSTAFPYGAFAPWGSITVSGNVQSFANPSFKNSFGPVSTVPVKIAAGEDLEVGGGFTLGQAISATGKVDLPTGSGAVPMPGMLFPDRYTQQIHDQVMGSDGAFAKINSDLVNKTDFVTGSVLDPIGFWKLLSGKENLTAIFSLQQACSMPMPVVPSFIDGEAYDIILFHNPFPSDFKGVAASIDLIKHIAEDLWKAAEAAEAAVVEAWKGVAATASGAWDDVKGAWDWITARKKKAKEEFEKAEQKYNEAKADFQAALDDLKNAFKDFADILSQVADAEKPVPPITSLDERNTDTVGWAYFGILSRIGTDLGDFFKAVFHSNSDNWNQLLSDLMNNTRVIDFVDRNPLGGFTEQGGFTLAMTWTVPRGRTLFLGNSSKPDYTMLGDLWIQRGATLAVEGSLFVVAPSKEQWTYNPASGNISDLRPTGTIYLEEGATLLVDGNLYASGDKDHGSVMITSPAGVAPPVSTAIFCSGDVRLPYGTGSGLTMDRLLDYLAKDLGISILEGVADDVLIPIMVDVAPHLGKAFGPFRSRICWFSDYAVSLVIIPELVEFGLQGPWPIPLPYTNCWKNVFNPLTEIFLVELNFTLGENLYLHSDWWPWGQGMVPVVPKVDPKAYIDVISEAFGDLNKDELSPEQILDTIGRHMEEVIPEFADDVFENVVQGIIKGIIGDAAGGLEDPCGSSSETSEQKTESEIKKALEEVAKDLLKVFAKDMFQMVGQILSAYRDEISQADQKQLDAQAGAAQELPGVFVYSGGELRLGEEVPSKAAGFFFAEGDLSSSAQQTFGCLVSRTGDINVQGDLYYYPFYSRASLWSPQKPSTYIVDGDGPKYLREAVDVIKDGLYLKTPTDGSTLSVGAPGAWTLAEGPR